MNRRSMLGWMLTSAATRLVAQTAPTPRPRPIDAPIDVVVPVPPTPFQADGKTHLVYEIHLTNFGRQECVLTRVEVPSLASYTGDELARIVMRPGPPQKEPLRIDGGLRAVLFVWITLEPGAAIPSTLEHRVGLKAGDSGDEFTSDCAHIP